MYPSPAPAAFQLHTGSDPPLLDDDDNDGYDGDGDDTPFSPWLRFSPTQNLSQLKQCLPSKIF